MDTQKYSRRDTGARKQRRKKEERKEMKQEGGVVWTRVSHLKWETLPTAKEHNGSSSSARDTQDFCGSSWVPSSIKKKVKIIFYDCADIKISIIQAGFIIMMFILLSLTKIKIFSWVPETVPNGWISPASVLVSSSFSLLLPKMWLALAVTVAWHVGPSSYGSACCTLPEGSLWLLEPAPCTREAGIAGDLTSLPSSF